MRPLVTALLALLVSGCNTCLDPESVPLEAGDQGSSEDVTVDAGPADQGGDTGGSDDAGPTDSGAEDVGPDAPAVDMPAGDVGTDMPTPPDMGVDMCVPEPDDEFCQAQGAECGALTGVDNCQIQRSANCGGCGANGSCSNNQCNCNDGYEPGGFGCVDIDECGAGTHDCDANATCTNSPGSFDCQCNDGFIGDGQTCVRPSLVKSVFHEAVIVDNLDETVATPAFDPAKTVPFMSYQTASSLIEGRLLDVELPASGTMELHRSQFGGMGRASVYGVEFDQARVESGRFTLSNTSTTIPFNGTVDPSRAFVVATVRAISSDVDFTDEYLLNVSFDANELTISRTAGGPTLVGGWWLVEATYDHFTTQHVDMSLTGTRLCDTVPITNVDEDKTFLSYSASWQGANVVSAAQISCRLASSTSVECCRLHSAGGSDLVDARVSVITFADWTAATVQRGQETMIGLNASQLVGISSVGVGADATVWTGRYAPMSPGASENLPNEADDEDGWVSVEFENGGASILLEREPVAGADARVTWEVVEWPD